MESQAKREEKETQATLDMVSLVGIVGNSLFNANIICKDDLFPQLHYNLFCNEDDQTLFSLNRVGHNLIKTMEEEITSA